MSQFPSPLQDDKCGEEEMRRDFGLQALKTTDYAGSVDDSTVLFGGISDFAPPPLHANLCLATAATAPPPVTRTSRPHVNTLVTVRNNYKKDGSCRPLWHSGEEAAAFAATTSQGPYLHLPRRLSRGVSKQQWSVLSRSKRKCVHNSTMKLKGKGFTHDWDAFLEICKI
jgi:hypothetical protein